MIWRSTGGVPAVRSGTIPGPESEIRTPSPPAEAAFLTGLDRSKTGLSGDALANFTIYDCGDTFGQEGRDFIRLNAGCARRTLGEILNKIYGEYQKRF